MSYLNYHSGSFSVDEVSAYGDADIDIFFDYVAHGNCVTINSEGLLNAVEDGRVLMGIQESTGLDGLLIQYISEEIHAVLSESDSRE